MSAEMSEAIARRYYEVAHNTRDPGLVNDLVEELLAPTSPTMTRSPERRPSARESSRCWPFFEGLSPTPSS
jgi:hypothetical protein